MRRILPDLGLEVDRTGSGYALSTAVSLDSRAFKTLVSGALSGEQDTNEMVASLDRALALWRGEPYGDLDLEPLIPGRKAELEELYHQALSTRIVAHMASNSPGHAVESAITLRHVWPHDAGVVEALAIALCQLGRRSEALEVIAEFRVTLRAELGLDPDENIEALEHAVLDGEELDPLGLYHWRSAVSRFQDDGLEPLVEVASSALLVGRRRLQQQLRAAVVEHRLVSLTGLGGIGKTALADDLIRGANAAANENVALVEVDRIGDPESLPKAFADAIGVPLAGMTDAEQMTNEVVDQLRAYTGLVVVDSCEVMIDAVARFVDRVLMNPGSVRLLITSREPLRLQSEHMIPVSPLDRSASVDLLIIRAQQVNRQLLLVPESQTLKAIAARLDGLPLALELAAAQLAYLGPDELLRLLNDRLEILRSLTRGEQRHESLVGVLESSWSLLSAQEQELLASTSIFGGTFSIDAAAAVFDSTPALTFTLLRSLHQKSLLKVASSEQTVRYELLETVRLFADRKLETVCSPEVAKMRHLDWLIGFGERLLSGIHTDEEAQWVKSVDLELPNIVATADWAVEQGLTDPLLRLCGLLEPEFFLRMRPELGPTVDRLVTQLDERGDPRFGLAVGSAFRLGFATGQRVAELSDQHTSVDWTQIVAEAPAARLCIAAIERAKGNYEQAVEWVLPLPDEVAALGQLGEASRIRATVALYRASVDRAAAGPEARRAVAECERFAGAGSTAIALAWAAAVVESFEEQLDYATRAVELAEHSGTTLAKSSALTRIAYCKALDPNTAENDALDAIRRTLSFHTQTLSAERQWSTVLMCLVGLVERQRFRGAAEAWAAVALHGPVGLATTSTFNRFGRVEHQIRKELGEAEFLRRTAFSSQVSPLQAVSDLLAQVTE